MSQNCEAVPLGVTETRIGNTTYVVSSFWRSGCKEDAVSKMKRILENEIRVQKDKTVSVQ